jgi:hypothetical protein
MQKLSVKKFDKIQSAIFSNRLDLVVTLVSEIGKQIDQYSFYDLVHSSVLSTYIDITKYLINEYEKLFDDFQDSMIIFLNDMAAFADLKFFKEFFEKTYWLEDVTDIVNSAINMQKYDTAMYLIKESGLSINFIEGEASVLACAAMDGWVDFFEYLVCEHPSIVNFTVGDNMAIKIASEHGQIEVVEYLFSIDPNIDATAEEHHALLIEEWPIFNLEGREPVIQYLAEFVYGLKPVEIHGKDISYIKEKCLEVGSDTCRELRNYLREKLRTEYGTDATFKENFRYCMNNPAFRCIIENNLPIPIQDVDAMISAFHTPDLSQLT